GIGCDQGRIYFIDYPASPKYNFHHGDAEDTEKAFCFQGPARQPAGGDAGKQKYFAPRPAISLAGKFLNGQTVMNLLRKHHSNQGHSQ
ncbi:MAG: hypothetical protein MUO52_11135, partial [Desulfobacterales bacterium]|nr:hypothetical protein [Desulfobacterales bacterium]